MTNPTTIGDTESLAKSLMPGRTDAVRRMFHAVGSPSPDIIWSPKDEDLRHPLLKQFATQCRALESAPGLIRAGDVDVAAFDGLSDWLLLIDVIEGGADFGYAYYGPAVADSYGRDMTGKRTSDFEGYISDFFKGLYLASLSSRQRVYSVHEPPRHVFVRNWHRLIVPLENDAGEIVRFLVLNAPENELRSGLELIVDPVFVLRGDETVAYANRAAKAMFDLPARIDSASSFENLTRISLDVRQSPVEMLANSTMIDSIQLTIRNEIVERLVMTVSAAQHRGDAFYVVVMRQIGS